MKTRSKLFSLLLSLLFLLLVYPFFERSAVAGKMLAFLFSLILISGIYWKNKNRRLSACHRLCDVCLESWKAAQRSDKTDTLSGRVFLRGYSKADEAGIRNILYMSELRIYPNWGTTWWMSDMQSPTIKIREDGQGWKIGLKRDIHRHHLL